MRRDVADFWRLGVTPQQAAEVLPSDLGIAPNVDAQSDGLAPSGGRVKRTASPSPGRRVSRRLCGLPADPSDGAVRPGLP